MSNFDNKFEIDQQSFNLINFDKFRKFLIKHNIISLALSIPMGYLLKDLVIFMLDKFFLKILDHHLNLKQLNKKFRIKLKNDEIIIGEIIYKIIHLLITLYLLFFFSRLINDLID